MLYTRRLFVLLLPCITITHAAQNQWLPGRRPPSGAPSATDTASPRPGKRLKTAEENAAALKVTNALSGATYDIPAAMDCRTASDIKHILDTNYGLCRAGHQLFGTPNAMITHHPNFGIDAELTKLPSDARVADYHNIQVMSDATRWDPESLTFNTSYMHPHLKVVNGERSLAAGGPGALTGPPALGEKVMIVQDNGYLGGGISRTFPEQFTLGEYMGNWTEAVRVEGGYKLEPLWGQPATEAAVNSVGPHADDPSDREVEKEPTPLTAHQIERSEMRTVVVGDFFDLSDYPDEKASGGSSDAPEKPNQPSVAFRVMSERSLRGTQSGEAAESAKSGPDEPPKVARGDATTYGGGLTQTERAERGIAGDGPWCDELDFFMVFKTVALEKCWYRPAAPLPPGALTAARFRKKKAEASYDSFLWAVRTTKDLAGKAGVQLEDPPEFEGFKDGAVHFEDQDYFQDSDTEHTEDYWGGCKCNGGCFEENVYAPNGPEELWDGMWSWDVLGPVGWAVKSVEQVAKATGVALPPRAYSKDEERPDGHWEANGERIAKDCDASPPIATTLSELRADPGREVNGLRWVPNDRFQTATLPDANSSSGASGGSPAASDEFSEEWVAKLQQLGTGSWEIEGASLGMQLGTGTSASLGFCKSPSAPKPTEPWREGQPTEVGGWVWKDSEVPDDESLERFRSYDEQDDDSEVPDDEKPDFEENLQAPWEWLQTSFALLSHAASLELVSCPDSDIEGESRCKPKGEADTQDPVFNPKGGATDPDSGRDWEVEPRFDNVWFGIVPQGYDFTSQPTSEILDASCSLDELSRTRKDDSDISNPWFAVGHSQKGVVKVDVVGRNVRYSILGSDSEVVTIEKTIPAGWESVALTVTMRQTFGHGNPRTAHASERDASNGVISATGRLCPPGCCQSHQFHKCPVATDCWLEHGGMQVVADHGETEEEDPNVYERWMEDNAYAVHPLSITIV